MTQQGHATCLVSEGGQRITEFMRLPESFCVIDGVRYRMARDKARFTLEGPLGVVAVAHRSGRREITIDSTPFELRLRRQGLMSSRWDVHAGGIHLCTCDVGVFNAAVDLPVEFPLPIRVFAFYTALMWGLGRFLPLVG